MKTITEREGDGSLRLVHFGILNATTGDNINAPVCGSDTVLEIGYEAIEELRGKSVVFSVGFYDLIGRPLFLCRSDLEGTEYTDLQSRGTVYCRIRRWPLPPGRFRMNLHCEVNGIVADWVRDALTIDVAEGDFYGSGRLPSTGRGDLLIDHHWFVHRPHPAER